MYTSPIYEYNYDYKHILNFERNTITTLIAKKKPTVSIPVVSSDVKFKVRILNSTVRNGKGIRMSRRMKMRRRKVGE